MGEYIPAYYQTEHYKKQQEQKQLKLLQKQNQIENQLHLEKLISQHIKNLEFVLTYLSNGQTTVEKSVSELERLNNLFTNRYKNIDIDKKN